MQDDNEVEDQPQVELPDVKHLEAVVEKGSGGLTAVASTNTTDRHGEIVDNNGWDLKAFKKNAVILWAHDHSQPAIGTSTKTWVEGTGKTAKLMFKPVFHGKTDLSAAMKALYEGTDEMAPVLNSFSVGFRPLESPDGITFTKNELLEISAVNVPANSEAMMMAYKGLKGAGFEDNVMKDLGIPVGVIDEITSLRKDISNLSEQVKELVKAPQAVNPSRERLSMLKVIARASDKLLEADNKQVVVDEKQLVKTIKKAAEIMTVAEKENLHG